MGRASVWNALPLSFVAVAFMVHKFRMYCKNVVCLCMAA